MRRTLLVLLLVFAAKEAMAERVMLPRPGAEPGVVELLLRRPDGPGPFPVLLLAHGHQSAPAPGGRVFDRLDRRPALATVDEGRLERMRDRGWIAAAVSLPGYGATPGPRDFFGPRSQAAVVAALDHLLALPGAAAGRVAVYGVSGGAMTAAVVATRDPRIAALVLVAGLYDLGRAYPTGDPGLDRNIETWSGLTPEAIEARSALRRAEGITAATLVLHGAEDRRGGVADQARELIGRLAGAGRDVRGRIFAGVPHAVPMALQWAEIDPFLRETIGR